MYFKIKYQLLEIAMGVSLVEVALTKFLSLIINCISQEKNNQKQLVIFCSY